VETLSSGSDAGKLHSLNASSDEHSPNKIVFRGVLQQLPFRGKLRIDRRNLDC
jgi:hypothetical protein